MNIYVANISFKEKETGLKALFENYGTVKSVKIITDRDTGRSRGFGFVEMEDANEGKQAIAALNGSSFGDRDLVVNEARPQQEK